MLEDLGEIPDALKVRIQKEADLQMLSKWLRTAAKAKSIAEFEKQI